MIDAELPASMASRVGGALNAYNAHASYWFSEEVALFVLTQMLAPWAQRWEGAGGGADGSGGGSARPERPEQPERPERPERPGAAAGGEGERRSRVLARPTLEATESVQGVSSLMLGSEITGMHSLVLAVVQAGRTYYGYTAVMQALCTVRCPVRCPVRCAVPGGVALPPALGEPLPPFAPGGGLPRRRHRLHAARQKGLR